MVQYSDEILNLFGAPELALLTVCGAEDLPDLPDYLSAALMNYITGTIPRDHAVLHLDLAFLRRAGAAAEEYSAGKALLSRYVEGLNLGEHRLKAYLSALTHFEQCVGAIWQAAELFNRMDHWVSGKGHRNLDLFTTNDGSDLERISKLNNLAKHFNALQAKCCATPVWITNCGLKCTDAEVSFTELLENVVALSKVAEETFINIPKEARRRQAARACKIE